jgi:hypothetical protein
LHGIYKSVYLATVMKNDNGLYIKLPERLKIHASKWAKDRGGLSKVVRDLLVKETKFKETNS